MASSTAVGFCASRPFVAAVNANANAGRGGNTSSSGNTFGAPHNGKKSFAPSLATVSNGKGRGGRWLVTAGAMRFPQRAAGGFGWSTTGTKNDDDDGSARKKHAARDVSAAVSSQSGGGQAATAEEQEVAMMRERLRQKQQKLLEKLALRKELQGQLEQRSGKAEMGKAAMNGAGVDIAAGLADNGVTASLIPRPMKTWQSMAETKPVPPPPPRRRRRRPSPSNRRLPCSIRGTLRHSITGA